jgi:hypothetical protein
MKKYRIREGSIADIARAVLVGVVFWSIIFWSIVTTYPY